MFTYSQKQEMKKNIIYITFILLLAIVSTYFIYHKFQGVRRVNFNSESLDVTYREKTGDKIAITKVTPVTDSVGLSSKAYLMTVKNNLTEKVDYQINIEDDLEELLEVEEEELIPKEDIRISVKAGKMITKIYTLDELENGILLEDTLNALEEKNIAIRVWIKQDCSIPTGSNMYYYGIIQVIEESTSLAIATVEE